MHDYLSLHKIVSRSEGRLRRIESMTRTDRERKDGKGFSSGFLVLRRDQDADRYKIQDLTPIGHSRTHGRRNWRLTEHPTPSGPARTVA